MTEREIFLAAIERPETERDAYLNEACGDDAALRAKVAALLLSHNGAGSFLGKPLVSSPDPDHAATRAFTPDADPTEPRATSDDEAEALSFLSPPGRPDSLGRIGHYEMLQILGRGGFGIVFRAFDDILQRVVAVKVMSPQLAATSPARKRFLREAQSSAQVRHENVVQVYEVGEKPLPHLVMEFIPGETLQQRLDRTGPVDAAETVRIGRQIAEGLAAAHVTDLIHRDIKPGNVLIEGGQYRVKITDFGLARTADDASISQSGIIAGTPMYMAPEQALGHKLDQRADLFSLGSVLYQMVAGRPPFRANSTLAVLKRVAEDTPRPIREIVPETPQWLCDIITKLHAKNPDERYQSARDVADVLADCEAQLKASSKVGDFSRIPSSVPSPGSTRRKKWVAAIACALPILAGVLVVLWRLTVGSESTTTVQKPVEPAASEEGWVQLFNGKDLTGWKTHPEQPGTWEVKGGILIGSTQHSHLFSERADFANFHLRAEMKLNSGGDSGIRFRTPFKMLRGKEAWQVLPFGGYEAEFTKLPAANAQTGSVWRGRVHPDGPPPNPLFRAVDPSFPRADEWCVYEVIADGNRFITKFDGKVIGDCTDTENTYLKGHLALQCFSAKTYVQFRKLEIKELSATPVAAPLPDYALDFTTATSQVAFPGWKVSAGPPMTFEAFITARDNNSSLFFNIRSPDHLRLTLGSNLGFWVGSSTAPVQKATTNEGLPLNRRVHLACVFDGKKPSIYVDGVRQNASISFAKFPEAGISEARIGNGPTRKGDPFNGVVDEIRISTIARYAGNFTPERRFAPDKDTLGLYHCDEGEGGELKDSSGNGHHGRIVGATWVKSTDSGRSTFKNSIGMEFVNVPKGKSWLGGGKDKPGDKEVDMPAEFQLGKYEVTQEEWEKVMGENPSHFSRSGPGRDVVKDISDADLKRFPVESLTWDQCQLFAAKLNQLEKDSGWVYRLPTAAEWEYACRGGPMIDRRDGDFDFYFAEPTNSISPKLANYGADKGLNRTTTVGAYVPNRLGLFDMHGNVYEWCNDVFKDPHSSEVQRVHIGGSWHADATYWLRAAGVVGGVPTGPVPYLGLRLARVPAVPPFTDADVRRISALPIAEQYEEVCKELRKRNPEFSAEITQEVRNGQILGLYMQKPGIRDLSPVRALLALERVEYTSDTLEDLSPLKGMRLGELSIRGTSVSDLSPLKGMPLKGLECTACKKLTDLSPLAGMPLTGIQMAYTPIKDLTPLKGMKLQDLNLDASPVSDLSPLAGMPLTHLIYRGTSVKDITVLKGMPLRSVVCDFQPARDAAILRGIKTLETINGKPAEEFWKDADKK